MLQTGLVVWAFVGPALGWLACVQAQKRWPDKFKFMRDYARDIKARIREEMNA